MLQPVRPPGPGVELAIPVQFIPRSPTNAPELIGGMAMHM
jgi:hypothetical protein